MPSVSSVASDRLNFVKFFKWSCRNGRRERLTEAAAILEKAPLEIDDNARTTTSTIRRSARKMSMKYGKLGAIFVDYIQKVTPPPKITLAVVTRILVRFQQTLSVWRVILIALYLLWRS